MKKIFLLWALAFLFTCIQAQDKGFGVGVRLGEPTGITAKYWLDQTGAIDFSLGYTFVKSDRKLYLSAAYLIHLEDMIQAKERLPFYYGLGARFVSRDNDSGIFGVKGTAGVAWLSRELPIDIFIEAAPVFNLFPAAELVFEAGMGVRYYFDKP